MVGRKQKKILNYLSIIQIQTILAEIKIRNDFNKRIKGYLKGIY
jgi:hypothetical protein